jgi:hypothetical protein
MSDEMEVSADSSSAQPTEPAAEPSQATTQPAPAQAQPKGFHEHPDWQRMVRSRHEDRQAMQALQREIQSLRQAGQQSNDQPLTQEETQALTVLKRLMARDPDLAAALGVAKQLPQFQQRFQGIDQIQAQAARAHVSAAKATVKELAANAGFKTDDASMNVLLPAVVAAAQRLENGNERYGQGDFSVFEEALNSIKPWFDELRKPAEQTVAQTKNKVRNLPPAPRGGAPGAPAPAKLVPGKEREFESGMHKRAKDMLSGLLQG